MANLTEPDEILQNFLRSTVAEVTRVGLSNRQTTDSESFNGTGAQTVFTITKTPLLAINSVTVDAVEMTAYLDYQIDIDNSKITFTTAPGSGTDNVVISLEKGSNWIFTDLPRDDLKKENYPRIGIQALDEDGNLQGLGEHDTWDTVIFQIDIVAYKDQKCTIATEAKQDMDVAQHLARAVRSAIKNNWQGKLLKHKLFEPVYAGNAPIPFDESNNMYRRVLTINFNAQNIGE